MNKFLVCSFVLYYFFSSASLYSSELSAATIKPTDSWSTRAGKAFFKTLEDHALLTSILCLTFRRCCPLTSIYISQRLISQFARNCQKNKNQSKKVQRRKSGMPEFLVCLGLIIEISFLIMAHIPINQKFTPPLYPATG